MKNVVINTERLTLKSPVDVVKPVDILLAINDRETLQYLSGAPKNYQLEDAKTFLNFLTMVEESDKTLQLGVFEKNTDQFMGMATLDNITHQNSCCELGYWISKPYTGKGLGLEASYGIIEYAFNTLKIQQIEAFVIKEHDKSMALLERLGFVKKELRIANETNDGVLVDQYRFLLEKGEDRC